MRRNLQRKRSLHPNGNRRSFAQLHNPYTLQNLVEAMNQQNARGEGAWGLSANTLMSTATAEYQNLDEVRADKSRLQQIPEEEYKALLEQADGQIEEVISRIRQETAAHSDSGYGEREILVKSFAGRTGKTDGGSHWKGLCKRGVYHWQGHGPDDPEPVQERGCYSHRVL